MPKLAMNPIYEENFSKLMNPSKVMSCLIIPGYDMNILMDMQRKNVEMLTTINQAVIDNLQSFAQRQTDLVQHIFEEATSAMHTMISAATPEEKVARQAETSKKMAEQCMANVRDTSEAFAKCNNQAMETVTARMSDNLVELRGMTKAKTAA